MLLVALLVHWPELSGFLSSNPLYFVSGIGSQWSGHVLPGFPGWIDFHVGATLQAVGSLAAWDWLHGRMPWWNPYIGVGLPLGGQPQATPFFLPFVLLLHFLNGTTYLKVVMQVIAGQATYALLRHLGLSRSAAVTGAVLYELNGMFAWFGDSPIMPIAFLPLCILGIERALAAARAGRAGGWVLIAIAVAYLCVAGFPETAYLSGLLALAWGMLRLVAARGVRLPLAGRVVGGGVLGLMIAAPSLLVFVEYVSRAWPQPRAYAHAGLLAENFTMYLFPYIFGPIHFNNRFMMWFHVGGYISLASLLLAVASVVGGRRERGLRVLLALWSVVGLAKSGAVPGFTEVVNLIPAITQMMIFRYFAPTLCFAVAVLAAFALDDWQRRRWARPARVVLTAALISAFVAIAVLLLGRPVMEQLWAVPGYRVYPVAMLIESGLVAAGIVAALLRPPSRLAIAVLCGLVVLDAAALFTVPLLAGTRHNRLDLAPVRFLQANLGFERYFTVGPLGPNYSSYFRIASINHNYNPLAANWADYLTAKLDPGIVPFNNIFNGTFPDKAKQLANFEQRMDIFAALGTKYVVTFTSDDPFARQKDGRLRQVFSDPIATIYALPHPAPYVSVTGGPCRLDVPARTEVHGRCDAPATLLRRELDFPGWHATVNGAAATIRTSDGLLQSVALPAGDVAVRFRYVPPFVGWTWPLSVAGLLAVGAGTVSAVRRAVGRARATT